MFTPHLAHYFRKLTTWARRPQRRHRLLWCEPLEGREVPAAMVSAILNAGVLTVSGLDAAIAGDHDHRFSIHGKGAGALHLLAGDNTQFISLEDGALNFSGVTSLVINLRIGNNVVD